MSEVQNELIDDLVGGDDVQAAEGAQADEPTETLQEGAEAAQEPTQAETHVEEENASEGADESQGSDTVPLATFLEQKNTAKSLSDENMALQAQLQALSALQSQIEQLRQERAQPEPEPTPEIQVPDFVEDPEGHVQARLAQKEATFTEQLKAMQSELSEAKQESQQASIQQAWSTVKQTEASFAEKHPDYFDAVAHARNMEVMKLEQAGYTTEQANHLQAQQEIQWALQVNAKGGNAAQAAYEIALKSGYTPAQADPAGQNESGDNEDSDEAARRSKAEAAQSMGGGSAPDLENLLDAEEDVFADAMKEYFGAQMH